METIGLIVIPLIVGIVFINGLIMIASPTLWFTLPSYIGLRGTLKESTYAGTGFGRFQIRVGGLILAGITGSMILSFFGVPYSLGGADGIPSGVPLDWWLCLVTCLGAIGSGLVMLLKPRWWMRRYFSGLRGHVDPFPFEWTLRILGVVFIGIGIYFLTQCTAFLS